MPCRYMKHKAFDAVIAAVGWYLYKTLQNRKALSQFTYSRALRHLHLIMAVGIFGAIGTVQAASRAEGQNRKHLLWWHKQTGIAMLVALFVRAFFRLRSGIPPRFPGHPIVQMIETQSFRAFYALALLASRVWHRERVFPEVGSRSCDSGLLGFVCSMLGPCHGITVQ